MSNLIVSLTSYPPRFGGLKYTLQSLVTQSFRPDCIVLWINEADVDKLPADVLAFTKLGVEVRAVRGVDLKCGKKIFPALISFADSTIVTCDDDVIYYKDWLFDLVRASRDDGGSNILCHRASICKMNGDAEFLPYMDWESFGKNDVGIGMDVFPTGVGGVLYPPGCFHPDVMNLDLFLKLCPNRLRKYPTRAAPLLT